MKILFMGLWMDGRGRPGGGVVRAGILLFLLLSATSCATQRIADGRFVHESKGYAFNLPAAGWVIDKDAWVHEQEFGRVFVKKQQSRYVMRRNQRSTEAGTAIEIRPRRPKIHEKVILDMDIGFRHETRPMQLLIGTISAGDLIRFLKGGSLKADSDLPENLIAGYLQHLQFFNSSQRQALITSRKLPQAGRAYRSEWEDGEGIRVLYGIALTRAYLFIALRADKTVSKSDLNEGLQDLDELVEACVLLQNN